MVKFLSKALSTLTLGKRGATKRKSRRPAKTAKPPAGGAPATKPETATETIESLEDEMVESAVSTSGGGSEPVEEATEAPEMAGTRPMTAERRALIREAMAVQRSKAKLLDGLSPEQRRKLRILAGKALLGE